MFAFSERDIVRYAVADEKDFYIRLLKNKDFSDDNPFLRRSLAKVTEDADIIEQELIRCLRYLQSKSPEMIDSWYEIEKEKLSPIWQQNNLEFPSKESLMKQVKVKRQSPRNTT